MSIKQFKSLIKAERKFLLELTRNIDNNPEMTLIDGFYRICERCNVYRNRDMGIIIKQNSFIMTPTTPLSVRVPTIKLENGWVVQPLVSRMEARQAVKLIGKKLGNFYCDLHVNNVGWWNGKPLMFDW